MRTPTLIMKRAVMTRYPKSGKGNKWTVKELDAIRPEWKGDQINDGCGLTGEVRVNSGEVSITFRYAFKWEGKVCWHYCGAYPSTEMACIRSERDKARDLIKAGVNPNSEKVVARIDAQAVIDEKIRAEQHRRSEKRTFRDLYDIWIIDGVSRNDGNRYIMGSFCKHALPDLGDIEIRHLTEHHLRDVYRKIIGAGKIATAVELSKDIGQMLRWAEKRKPWRALLIDGNPSDLVEIKKLLPGDYVKERKRLLSTDEIVNLKRIFDMTEEVYIASPRKYDAERALPRTSQIAIWVCLSTLCRTGELHMTEWKHVDFKKRTWFIPAQNTKGERGKKRDQLVYLSDFTLNHFRQLYVLTGHSRWAFPGKNIDNHICIKDLSKKVGDRQIQFKCRKKKQKNRLESNSLVLGEDEWTPHDLRRTGATMMQKLGVTREVVNLCQNHVVGSVVDRSYLLDEYADAKRSAWNSLGNRLEEMMEQGCSAQVIRRVVGLVE